ncbi:Membrane protein, partial [Globisporangium splendens]
MHAKGVANFPSSPQVFFLPPSREIASSGTSVCAVFEGLFGTAPSYNTALPLSPSSHLRFLDARHFVVRPTTAREPSAMNADEDTMLGVDPVSTASPAITRDDCLHLSDLEWSALQLLGKVVGEMAIFAILATCPPEQHRLATIGFLQKEAKERGREATRAVTAQVQPPRQKALQLDVAKYDGGDKEPLLRCDIRAAFEPPKSEFRTRTEFLEIRQDRRDLHAYIQHARYLVSSIVSEPIDMATQVATSAKGLTDGPVKTYLFREYLETLEQAIALALREDFSAKQARLHANPHRAAQFRHAKPSPHVGFSTGEYASGVIVVHETQAPSVHDARCWTTTTADESRDRLIQLEIIVEGFTTPLRGLLDTGAPNNFVRSHVTRELARVRSEESHSSESKITVRLATGATVTTEERVMRLRVTHDGRQMEGDFIWLDLDGKFDVILGMPWLKKYQPIIDWNQQSIRYPATKRKQADRPSARDALAASEHDARVCDGPLSTTSEGKAT